MGEEGLAEYIFKALIPQRPNLIPWALANASIVELASYLLRARSGSKNGFYGYSNTVSLYCRRLNATPDQIIADVKPGGTHSDPGKLEKHRTFLQQCINEHQDA